MILATPAQKQKVTWFSQQFNFTTKKNENFGKIWVVDVAHLWFKGKLHSNLWNVNFVNKLQFSLILRSFVFKAPKNW